MWPLLLLGGGLAVAAAATKRPTGAAAAAGLGRSAVDPTELVKMHAPRARASAGTVRDHRRGAPVAGAPRSSSSSRARAAGATASGLAKAGVQTAAASWGVPPSISGKAYDVGADVVGEIGSWF